MPIAADVLSEMLDLLAPVDESVYFALFEDAAATLELTVAGYARVEYSGGWSEAGGVRENVAAIEWGAFSLPVVFRAVGIFNVANGGQPRWWVETRSLQGEESEIVVELGDVCAVPPGAARVTPP